MGRKFLLLAYSLVSLVLDMSQMFLALRKHFQMTNKIMLHIVIHTTFPENCLLGKSLPLVYTMMSLVLYLAQMVYRLGKLTFYCGHSLYQYYSVMILSGRYGLSQKPDLTTQN